MSSGFVMLTTFITQPIALWKIQFPFSLLGLLLQLVIPVILILAVGKLLKLSLTKLIKSMKIREDWKKQISRWGLLVLRLSYIVICFALLGRLLGAETGKYLGMFKNILNEPFLQAGETSLSIVTLILLVPVFYLASYFSKLALVVLDKSVFDPMQLDEAKKFSMNNIIRYGLQALIILFGLSMIGIDLSSLTLIFGVLGIGLGFGLQNTVANFFAGLIIIFARPIKEKDRIQAMGHEGTVVKISLLSTVISTLTHENIIIPNSRLVDNEVYNYTYDDRMILLKNSIQVSYSTDLDALLPILEEVGRSCPYRIEDSEILTRVTSFDDSGITVKVLVWVSDISKKYDAHHWMNLALWRSFRDNGVEIPFPHRVLIQQNTEE